MSDLQVIADIRDASDRHLNIKSRAETVFYGLIANGSEMQKFRMEARQRLKGVKSGPIDVARMAGRLAFEEAFFLAQGAEHAEAAIDAAVARERAEAKS